MGGGAAAVPLPLIRSKWVKCLCVWGWVRLGVLPVLLGGWCEYVLPAIPSPPSLFSSSLPQRSAPVYQLETAMGSAIECFDNAGEGGILGPQSSCLHTPPSPQT